MEGKNKECFTISHTFTYDDVVAWEERDGKYYIGVYNKSSCPDGLGMSVSKELYEKIISFKEKDKK